MNEHAAVKLADLEEALRFVDAGGGFDTAAWVCRATGEVLWHSEYTDDSGPLPKDIDDDTRYVAVPCRRDLNLGISLPLEFARTQLPECYDEVRAIFSCRGAYARFKNLVDRHDRLDAWHQWEEDQTREALRAWCADNDIELAD